jgi:cytochrome P450 family 628
MIDILQEGMKPLGVLTPIPWILPILLDIPGLSGGVKAFQKYNKERVATRKQVCFSSTIYPACLT